MGRGGNTHCTANRGNEDFIALGARTPRCRAPTGHSRSRLHPDQSTAPNDVALGLKMLLHGDIWVHAHSESHGLLAEGTGGRDAVVLGSIVGGTGVVQRLVVV